MEKMEKKQNQTEGLFWQYGHLGQKDAECCSCLGAPNTFPVVRKSWSSPVFRRVAPGAGLRRCIGSAELQVWLHDLDYIFCPVCQLSYNTRLMRHLLLLSVVTNCLSLSEHLTSLSREKPKKVCQYTSVGLPCPLPSQLLSYSVIFPVHCTVSSWALFLKSIFFSWTEGQVKWSSIRFLIPTITGSRPR